MKGVKGIEAIGCLGFNSKEALTKHLMRGGVKKGQKSSDVILGALLEFKALRYRDFA